MGAIFGCFSSKKNIYESGDVSKLLAWNRLHGRDSEKVTNGDSFFLGCCLDEAFDKYVEEYAEKTSPVIELPDNRVAVVDALIYNREELKRNLHKNLRRNKDKSMHGNLHGNLLNNIHATSCTNDAELLTEYISRNGIDSLAEINGDFAGVIYDRENSTFTVFRDHMGVRPLYVYSDGDTLVFSTDIRGILSQQYTKVTVSDEWIYKIAIGKNPYSLTNTEYKEIKCATPGAYSVYSVKGAWMSGEPGKPATSEKSGIAGDPGVSEILKKTYWRPGRKKIRLLSEKKYARKMNSLITEAIRRRIAVCPDKIGAELSGGIDSGVISILLNRLGENAKYFSWSVSPEEVDYVEGDERLIIQDICRQENICCSFRGDNINIGESSDLFRASLELPCGVKDSDIVQEKYCLPAFSNTGSICDTGLYMRENGVKLVFTGHGGDEGVSHRSSPFEMYYKKEYLSYFRHMWWKAKGSRFRLKRTLGLMKRDIRAGRRNVSGKTTDRFKQDGVLKKSFFEGRDLTNAGKKYFTFDALAYVMDGGSRGRLDNVALYQAYSNVRYVAPFLDYNVIDYALSIPRHLYLKKGMNRYIYRQAFKDIMPESLYTVTEKSTRSHEKLEIDYDVIISDLETVVSKLKRQNWEKIIDFEYCDRVIAEQKAAEKKDSTCLFTMTYLLCSFFTAQSLTERLKE